LPLLSKRQQRLPLGTFSPHWSPFSTFGLSDVFGVDVEGAALGRLVPVTRITSGNLFGAPQDLGGIPFRGLATDHSYLELKPQYEGQPAAGTRHPIIRGWLDEADFLLFGGVLTPLRVHAGRDVLMTWRFRNARPVSLAYSPLLAMDAGVLMETIEIAFDGVEMV
jgi:hypothetical protein